MGEMASLAVGSVVGGLARHLLGGAVQRLAGNAFPYGTLLVNLSGCFLVGLLHSLVVFRFSLGTQGRMLLMVGFCGAFTTFSTLMLDTALLLDEGKGLQASFNLAASVLLGLALFKVGAFLGQARWLVQPGLDMG